MPEEYRPRAPELPEWLAFVWRCFQRLRHDRPWLPRFEGPPIPGRIPWRDVMAWADRHGLGAEDAELLDAGMQAMDSAYLEWWEAEQKRQGERGKGGGGIGGKP